MIDEVAPFRGQRLGLAGAALVALAAFLAWTSVQAGVFVTPGGSQLLVLGAAFVAWVVILLSEWGWLEQLIVAAVGALVLGVAGERFWVVFEADVGIGPGIGLYIAVLGGLFLVVGGALDYLAG